MITHRGDGVIFCKLRYLLNFQQRLIAMHIAQIPMLLYYTWHSIDFLAIYVG